ncbi:MAG: MinD/ParA family ATP-binding protein [Stackebrandtia sp.]
MLVVVGAAKGAPGVTATVVALAAVWPRDVVVVEVDPAGGDLALRLKAAGGGALAPTPSLLDVAAAARGGVPGSLRDYAQQTAAGYPIICGLAGAAQSRGLAGLWPAVASALAVPEVDVLVDAGRIDASAPTLPVLQAADRVLLVQSATLEAAIHSRETLADLTTVVAPDREPRLKPVVVSPVRHGTDDVTDVNRVFQAAGLIVAEAAHLALDAPALAQLEAGVSPRRKKLARSPLVRQARELARVLTCSSGVGVSQ